MQTGWLQHARPHLRRAAIYAAVAIAGLVASTQGQIDSVKNNEATSTEQILAYGGAALLLVAGIASVRAAARGARASSSERFGDARGAVLGVVVSIAGYFIVTVSVLAIIEVNVSGLLLGGAITGVVIGIAAQQTLGNFFAGLVLISIRPLRVGEDVVMRSGPLGGEYEGRVTDMGMFYVDLMTRYGPVKLPNAGVLASAIGPGARVPKDESEPKEEEQQQAPSSEGGAPDAGKPPG
ncbi:MAG: mechanosensitive ion channel family protein [Actinomycetota bacterium]